MDTDELVKLNLYLTELRSLDAMQSSSQQVEMLEKTMGTMKMAIDVMTRSKIKQSAQFLNSEQIIRNLRQDCEKWEQLVSKTIILVDDSHKKIDTLAQAVAKLIDPEREEIARNAPDDENGQNEALEEFQNGELTEQMDEGNVEDVHVLCCDGCPKTFNKLALLYRHRVKYHGQHSATVKQKKLRKSKGKMVSKRMRNKRKFSENGVMKVFESIVGRDLSRGETASQ